MIKNTNYIKNNLSFSVKVSGIYTIHYFKYGKNFRFKDESHDFWEMVFIDSGNAKIIVDKKTLSLKQGEAIFHYPNRKHTIYTDDEFANSAIISFECKSLPIKMLSGKVFTFDDYEKTLLNKIIQEGKLSYEEKLNDVNLTKMTKRKDAPFGGEQIIKNSIELLLVSLLRKEISPSKTHQEVGVNLNSNQIVDNIKSILDSKLDNLEKINLDELSYALGFSKSYIKSQFKKKTGLSIIQYFINLKIDKAKKLLSQHKYTISEISDNLGFSSIHYFSRQFKVQTDMTPTEYVNSIKADNVL
jgi:AraC-like DNA-binding protein